MDLFPLSVAINTQLTFAQSKYIQECLTFSQNCTHLTYFVSNFQFHPLYLSHNVSAQCSNGRDATGWQLLDLRWDDDEPETKMKRNLIAIKVSKIP